jgi:hypothetical protein
VADETVVTDLKLERGEWVILCANMLHLPETIVLGDNMRLHYDESTGTGFLIGTKSEAQDA